MRVLGSIAASLVASVGLSALAARAQQPDETTMAMLGYISGMASTHYCTCKRWPSSWAEFKNFDDRWHAHSQSQGGKPVQRLPWAELAESRTSIAPAGHLSICVRQADREPIDIGAPFPDCSGFHPEVVAHLCSAVRQ